MSVIIGRAPCSSADALARIAKWLGKCTYVLGGGGFNVLSPDNPTKPKRRKDGTLVTYALDCSGWVTYLYKLLRTRKGFNVGKWATVSHAINTDSIVEDAEHKQELFYVVAYPVLGDLIVYPGSWEDSDGDGDLDQREDIGHVGIIVGVPAEWDPARPQYELLTVVHCSPSNAKRKWKTGVKRTNGALWVDRKGRAKTRIVRVKQPG